MNPNRKALDDERELLLNAAWCMKRRVGVALDGEHAVDGIPETWAYALLAMAGWLETEADTHNSRTRPYALTAARSFIYGDGAVL